MPVRIATENEAPALAGVFYRAVREGPSPYTANERAAWVPEPPDPARFSERLAEKHVMLWEKADEITGFMTIEVGGYIDLAFILSGSRGQGVFRALYDAIEQVARDKGETRLWTHASLSAQPAFRAMGFAVMHHETVVLAGENLSRALMEKILT